MVRPSINGEFEGNNSFVVRSLFSFGYHGGFRPIIEGYFLPAPSGGTDVVLRSAYPGFVWLFELGVFLLGAIAIAITATKASDFLFTLPAVAMLAFFTIGVVAYEGSSFANRVVILLSG